MDAAGKKEGWLMSLSRVSCGIHLKELPLVLGAFIFFPCEGAPIVPVHAAFEPEEDTAPSAEGEKPKLDPKGWRVTEVQVPSVVVVTGGSLLPAYRPLGCTIINGSFDANCLPTLALDHLRIG